MKSLYILSLNVFIVTLVQVFGATSDDLKHLLRDLFINNTYNKYVRPSKNFDKITNITASFELESIESLDEKQGVLTTTGILNLQWKDQLLVWDPSDYGDLNYFFIPPSQIWTPDVALWNGVSESTSGNVDSFQTRVLFDGSVDWVSFNTLRSKCKVEVIYFPFDSQSCNITFVARNTPYEVGFVTRQNGFAAEDVGHNGEWEVLRTDILATIYDTNLLMMLSLDIKRKPALVIFNMLLPILILAVLNIFTFAFPSRSGEKMGFSITVFLAFAVFMTIITGSLPDSSNSVSYVGIYLVIQLVQSALIVIISALQIRLMLRSDDKPVNCVLKKLVRIVDFKDKCKYRKRQNKTEHSNLENIDLEGKNCDKTGETIDENDNITWNDVSDSLDFYFFIFFTAVLFFSTVIMYAVVTKM